MRPDGDALDLCGRRLPLHRVATIGALPLDGVDMVLDCTGHHKTAARLAPY